LEGRLLSFRLSFIPVIFQLNLLIQMAQGNSIFSNPSSPNGNAPANPFASLNPQAASPFAAAESPNKEEEPRELDSPFGFAEEVPTPKSHIPEKRSAGSPPAASGTSNPFASAPAGPPAGAESGTPSPFAPSMGFEAPEEKRPASADYESFEAPSSDAYRAPSSPAPSVEKRREPPENPVFHQPHQPSSEAASSFSAGANVPSQSHAGSRGGHSTRQLELRAIFGVEGEMSREEILQHAKQLPGIRELSVVGSGEMNALETLGDVMSRFGYGDSSSWQVTCSGGVVDFVSGENTTLAVLREGRYSAGVWEKLMIVARELGKLG
jgi:hypothetical protein